MASPPRAATRRTRRRNCAGRSPVNGWIHSGRDAEITCTWTSLAIVTSSGSRGHATLIKANWHRETVTELLDWLTCTGLNLCDDPLVVDEALNREDRYAGVALIALTLNHVDPFAILPRIKRALGSTSPQTRANALQCLGHLARLHGLIDQEAVQLLVRALRDRTRVDRSEIRGYANAAADDVASFIACRSCLPRWFRRRRPGPQRPAGLHGRGKWSLTQ